MPYFFWNSSNTCRKAGLGRVTMATLPSGLAAATMLSQSLPLVALVGGLARELAAGGAAAQAARRRASAAVSQTSFGVLTLPSLGPARAANSAGEGSRGLLMSDFPSAGMAR